MRTRTVKIKVGSIGWTREDHGMTLPVGCPAGLWCKIYQLRPKTREYYVVDGRRHGHTIPEECFEPQVEIQLPYPQRGWAHETDPRALEALREEVVRVRNHAVDRPDLYPHFQERILARNSPDADARESLPME